MVSKKFFGKLIENEQSTYFYVQTDLSLHMGFPPLFETPLFEHLYIFCFVCLVLNSFWSCSNRSAFQNEFCDHNGFSGSLLKIHWSREHQSDARTAWRPASDWVSANHQRSSFAPSGGGCRQTPLAAHFTQRSSLIGEYHKSDKILGVCMNLRECHLGNLGLGGEG